MGVSAKYQIYRCTVCGNVVEVLKVGGGTLVCCGQEMELIAENTVEASKEKHIPVVEKTAEGYSVKVGSVTHPMEEKHYIEWIELITASSVFRKELKPGDAPEAFFKTNEEAVAVREHCNLHGLWKA